MIEQALVGRYQIEFDREATAAAYARVPAPAPEECGCAYCRNWIAGRQRFITPAIRQFLARFAIPANGEIDVTEIPGGTKPHGYHGWYLFVGRIVSGPMNPDPIGIDGFDFHFWEWETGPTIAVPAFQGLRTCDLWFSAAIDEYLSPDEYA